MTDVPLAKPYAPDNYAKALANLVKRFEADGEPVHYSNAAFDGVSDDQAQSALKFLGDIGLIKIDKQAHYEPPDSVVTWQRSMPGPAKQEAKSEVRGLLEGYEVYDEAKFLLVDGGRELEPLAKDIGGKIGISEDDLPMLIRSIEVMAACEFLGIDEDEIVSLPDEEPATVIEESSAEDETDEVEETDVPSNDEDLEDEANIRRENGGGIEISITLDMTELSEEEIRNKLGTIRDVLYHDEE